MEEEEPFNLEVSSFRAIYCSLKFENNFIDSHDADDKDERTHAYRLVRSFVGPVRKKNNKSMMTNCWTKTRIFELKYDLSKILMTLRQYTRTTIITFIVAPLHMNSSIGALFQLRILHFLALQKKVKGEKEYVKQTGLMRFLDFDKFSIVVYNGTFNNKRLIGRHK